MSPVYITALGAFLPNPPVDNEQIENVLGKVHDQPSAVKELILLRNGIRTRHYALDPVTKAQTHTNAQLTVAAIKALCANSGLSLDEIECLVCGTSSPDQIIPNHGCMVHGELQCPAIEVASTAGVCVSGMTSFKYGYLNVLSGLTKNAVTTGSELASVMLQGRYYEMQFEGLQHLEDEPYLTFGQDFLRWMLSDGAGAALLEPEPRPGRLNLRVDWVDIISLANERETCMYFGGKKLEDGSLRSWRSATRFQELLEDGYLNLTQDAVALGSNMVPAFKDSFSRSLKAHDVRPEDVDWVLPHLSSMFFKDKIMAAADELGFKVPEERWFTNLADKGNTGSASIYIILEELLNEGRLSRGQRLLCGVPESARFSFAYMMLTVV